VRVPAGTWIVGGILAGFAGGAPVGSVSVAPRELGPR
jgi:hypothetical protein